MDTTDNYWTKLASLPDEELARIVHSDSTDYRPEAISAAAAILRSRGIEPEDPELARKVVAADNAYVATRPLLLKAIAAFYFVFPLVGLLIVTSGRLPMSPDPDPYWLTFVDHSLSFAFIGAEVTGAVLLWQLRRSAFTFFAGALTVCIFSFWWYVLIRGWVGALHRTTPHMTYPILTGAVSNAALLLSVCIYTWQLRSSGLLK